MSYPVRAMSLVLPFLFALIAFGQPDSKLPPIKALNDVKPKPSVFDAAGRGKPVTLRSAEDAAKHFSEDELAKLVKRVDFEQQIVLVFAWRGSGQDRLEHAVAESYPEQIFFTLKPGRTRDLRRHVKVFALRANVKWSVKIGR